ncbi:5,10-methylenetetrahydromethanopterin reductase [Microbacterium sp. cf046]|uniref:LLM class flavin-dependent oxidoreductase n=1 Tax=Microbacterium sp. cf046 TaxID=1761803 RepID=UPI0008DF05AD|nr:LLM class flavin-dependent oxidoreductase [Microbacterium sp. cf046]SFS15475.1 5,10-methylenetetrahydromethanopterin reductase [Microbacterium sp. cf046]
MSNPVRISLGLQTDKSVGEYARLAALAEGLGFDGVSVFSDLLYQPPVAALLEMAGATSRITLGCACWNPYTLHPYEIAGQFATVDAASGGRAYLGLAKGSWLEAIGLEAPKPIAHLRDAIGVIRTLLDGEGRGYDGSVFRVEPGTRLRYPVRRSQVPILIGSWGPLGMALAGELADEVKIGGSANPAMVAVVRARVKRGLERAGRPADAVGVVLGAVTVVDRDGDLARAHARREVAMYLDVVAALDPTVVLPDDLLPGIRARLADGDSDAAGRLVPRDVLDLFAFSGTPADVAAQANRLIEAGADRIEFGTPHGIDSGEGIELLGREVLPGLER